MIATRTTLKICKDARSLLFPKASRSSFKEVKSVERGHRLRICKIYTLEHEPMLLLHRAGERRRLLYRRLVKFITQRKDMSAQISLSFELISLLNWLLRHEKTMLNNVISHSLERGFAEELE